MSDTMLTQQIQALYQRYSSNSLEQEFATLSSDYQRIEQQIKELQEQQSQILRRQTQVKQQLLVDQQDFQQDIQSLRSTWLEQNQISSQQFCEYLQKRQDLEREVQYLQAHDPEFESWKRSYHMALNAIETLKSELTGKALQSRLLREEQSITEAQQYIPAYISLFELAAPERYELDLLIQAQDQLLEWIIPIAVSDTLSATQQQLLSAIYAAISSLQQNADWQIADLEQTQSQGLYAMHCLCGYQDLPQLAKQCSAALRANLAEQALFLGLAVQVRVHALPSFTLTFEPEPSEPEPEAAVEPEPSEAPVQTLQDSPWYMPEDLRRWSDNSVKLTPLARYARTLLMRLIAQGKIDRHSVSLNELCAPLPIAHAASMRESIATLVDQELLLALPSEQLTINGKRLNDIQSLINRSNTEQWNTVFSKRTSN
jgi:predicted amino acid-binding ACT domain protein